MRVTRPVWRRFTAKHQARAASWVREGGSAAVFTSPRVVHMILGAGDDGKITEAGLWSVLALEQQRYRRSTEGPFRGLFRVKVKPHAVDAVADWCDRDGGHPSATRDLELDCLDCAACCHDANVLLDDDDLERFRDAGRTDLTKPPFVRRARDGKVTLRFLGPKCQHLKRDNKCRIYAIRPFNCSVFPVGSEACLAARESTLNLRDDAESRLSP
ncbi:MAG: YkgJ family cysteine cluster protein [Polyangiaceae bacterium]